MTKGVPTMPLPRMHQVTARAITELREFCRRGQAAKVPEVNWTFRRRCWNEDSRARFVVHVTALDCK